MQQHSIKPTCPNVLEGPGGNDNVRPTISGPNTLWWFKGLGLGVSGYASQITLTANSGGTGTSYQWTITAGSDKVSLSASTSATVQVTSIGQSKTQNDVSITVTVGGLTSAPFNLTVRAPYTLGSNPSFPTPVYAADQDYVWNITIYYNILDNLLAPMPSPVWVNEDFTTGVVADYPGENWQPPGPAVPRPLPRRRQDSGISFQVTLRAGHLPRSTTPTKMARQCFTLDKSGISERAQPVLAHACRQTRSRNTPIMLLTQEL